MASSEYLEDDHGQFHNDGHVQPADGAMVEDGREYEDDVGGLFGADGNVDDGYELGTSYEAVEHAGEEHDQYEQDAGENDTSHASETSNEQQYYPGRRDADDDENDELLNEAFRPSSQAVGEKSAPSVAKSSIEEDADGYDSENETKSKGELSFERGASVRTAAPGTNIVAGTPKDYAEAQRNINSGNQQNACASAFPASSINERLLIPSTLPASPSKKRRIVTHNAITTFYTRLPQAFVQRADLRRLMRLMQQRRHREESVVWDSVMQNVSEHVETSKRKLDTRENEADIWAAQHDGGARLLSKHEKLRERNDKLAATLSRDKVRAELETKAKWTEAHARLVAATSGRRLLLLEYKIRTTNGVSLMIG